MRVRMLGLQRIFLVAQNKYKSYCKRVITQTGTFRFTHNSVIESDNFEDDAEEKNIYNEISSTYLGNINFGHRVFVLQPYIKWGRDKKRNTTPELQLSEAVALVNTLPHWSIAGKKCIPLLSLQKNKLLGSGTIETLKREIESKKDVTAIFISTNLLKFVQITLLQKIFDLPIYDRYSMVIHIFRLHAKSPEARLQVALAELPFIRKRIDENEDESDRSINFNERKKKFLESREKKLRNGLKKLEEHRKLIRKQRNVCNFPTVAMIGYTNAGKTSLIKVLTDDSVLCPEDKLFATLDTTVHQGILPCKLKVLYVDTIGFIQDVPETLIEPFKVTLEDALIADVIVHVYDVSHPDMQAQLQHVQETIKPMINDKVVINVANKCDLAEEEDIPEDALAVSAIRLTGINRLRLKIEKELLAITGRKRTYIRVESGSKEAAWLYKETTVSNAEVDPKNSQYLLLDVITTPRVLQQFRQYLKK